MAGESLNSADELNIDGFFSPDSGNQNPVADSDEAAENAPEEDEQDTDDEQGSESDQEEDDDIDDEEDEEEDSVKDDVPASKLAKKAEHAEKQRRQIQSQYDQLLAQFNKQQTNFDKLNKRIEQIENQAGKSELNDVFTGDDDSLLTEGQIKKLLEKQASQAVQPSTGVGSDIEAQQFWANSQPDVAEITEFYNENVNDLNPELVNIPSLDGRYLAIRSKKLETELKAIKSEKRKLKKQIQKMRKGSIPETGAGSRASNYKSNKPQSRDVLDNFFSQY